MASDAMIAPAIARVVTKTNTHRIENNNLKLCLRNMGTGRIVWHVTCFLGFKHRVGLLMASTCVLLAYIAYDKLSWLF